MERLNFNFCCMLVVFQSFAILQYPLLCYAFINFCFSFWDRVLFWYSPGKSWTCNLPAFPELQKITTPAKNFKEKNNLYRWVAMGKCLWDWNWAIAAVTGPSGPVLISLASPNLGGVTSGHLLSSGHLVCEAVCPGAQGKNPGSLMDQSCSPRECLSWNGFGGITPNLPEFWVKTEEERLERWLRG